MQAALQPLDLAVNRYVDSARGNQALIGMSSTERGKVQRGVIVLARPLGLPDSAEVVVQVLPLDSAAMKSTAAKEDPRSLPFLGMWADCADMSDTEAWLQRERDLWQQRATRPD